MPEPKSFEQLAAKGRAKKEQEQRQAARQADEALTEAQRQKLKDDAGRDLRFGSRTAQGLGTVLFSDTFFIVTMCVAASLAALASSGVFWGVLGAGLLLFLIPVGRRFWDGAAKRELAWLESLPFSVEGYREALSIPASFGADLMLMRPVLVIDFKGHAPPEQTLQDALSLIAPECLAFAYEPNGPSINDPRALMLQDDIKRTEHRWLITNSHHRSRWQSFSGVMNDTFSSIEFVRWFHSFVEKLLCPLSKSYPITAVEISIFMIIRGRAKERGAVLQRKNKEWRPQ